MTHIHKKNKRIVIQVAGNPLYQQPRSKNSNIDNPKTGTKVFGNFPNISLHGFEAGEIILKYGEHKGPHKGFGFLHIWLGHFKHITDPAEAETFVCDFVNSVIDKGGIFYDANGKRNLLFKGGAGTVVLEKSSDANNNTVYTIITAIPHGQSSGFKIGNMP